jgi:hypothetical protein
MPDDQDGSIEIFGIRKEPLKKYESFDTEGTDPCLETMND